MLLLALGLTLNTKVFLGVSPLIAAAYAAVNIWGLNLGNTVFAWYCVFVLIELVLHCGKGVEQRKRKLLIDMLQLPLSLAFGQVMNFFSLFIPDFAERYSGQFAGSIPCRILILIAAIIITGSGAALVLNMRLVPNPGDGAVQSLADWTGSKLGNCKNLFDTSCVAVAVALGLVGNGKIVGVGVGTLLAMLLTGRVIAVFNRFFAQRLQSLITPVEGAEHEAISHQII